MDFERFTEKARQAVMECQNIAISQGNQQLEGEHLHMALLQQDQGLIGRLLDYMEISKQAVEQDVQAELDKLPKVEG